MRLIQNPTWLFVAFICCVTSYAFAGQWKPFAADEFAKAQAEGKVILLEFHASWCGTCKKQREVLKTLLDSPEFRGVIGFTVDFDSSDNLKSSLQITKQSTLVLFKGSQEIGRTIGITRIRELDSFVRKGL